MNTIINSQKSIPPFPGGQRTVSQPSLAKLLDMLVAKDTKKTEQFLSSLISTGSDGRTILRDIFQPLFQQLAAYISTGQISQARANVASEIAFQMIRGVIDRYSPKGAFSCSKLAIGCIKGDAHDLGCRLVANSFEMAGWDVDYLGGDLDKTEFVQRVVEAEPDLVGISISNLIHVPALKELITELHNCEIADRFKIMVGGYPFSVNPTFAIEVGADFTARNAAEAVSKARRYVIRYTESAPIEVTTFVV
ncbi:MAG TPA: cobalamin-dependent protein [Blastocatellia bacterium]|nr:cobalamin-dependent protein [Blastocatellia bacterium]